MSIAIFQQLNFSSLVVVGTTSEPRRMRLKVIPPLDR